MQITSRIVFLPLAIWLSAAAVLPLFEMNFIASQAGFVSYDATRILCICLLLGQRVLLPVCFT
jgi:hypothetical protein